MILHPTSSPWLNAATVLAYVVHIGGGTLAFGSGAVALLARKGGHLHRVAGSMFFVSMLAVASFAAFLAVVIPGQLVNLFIGAFTFYLVATARMTVRRKAGSIGLGEKIALAAAVILSAPFVILAIQLATGLPPLFTSAVPFEGPVLIAIYLFASVLVIAAIADARLVLVGGIAGAPRIARHLWRVCLAFTLAAGSFFTNALPRLLPGRMHVTLLNFLPQLFLLGLLLVWMIRVRFTPWLERSKAV
ncbi:MAG TPA: hypothetical protein VII63_10860 [Caulobacteraceae bacterium]